MKALNPKQALETFLTKMRKKLQGNPLNTMC